MIALALLVAALNAPVNAGPPRVDARTVADKWVAIAVSLEEGAPTPVLPAVAGATWQRVRSLSLKNFMPCYDVIYGGAFADKASATALVKKMRDAGINAYAKQSGKFVGEPPSLVAHCARRDSDDDGTCGALSFVEEHGKERLFAKVEASGDVGVPARTPKVLDGDRRTWVEPLAANARVGAWTKGYALDVYDVANGKRVHGAGADGSCAVERLVWLTRGEPHFGYMQSEEKPTAPGCGEPELFAELSCKGSGPVDAKLALPAGHRPPRLFTPSSEIGASLQALGAHVEAMPEAREAKARAAKAAAEQKLPVGESMTTRRFTSDAKSVVVVTLTWSTGEANPCSGDVIESVTAVVEPKGERFVTSVPAWSSSSQAEVRAVYDLEGDGKLEIVERDLSTLILRRADSTEICSDVVPFCDCGC